jgi:hypothetical protein
MDAVRVEHAALLDDFGGPFVYIPVEVNLDRTPVSLQLRRRADRIHVSGSREVIVLLRLLELDGVVLPQVFSPTDKFCVGPFLYDATVLQNNHPVGVLDGG